MDSPPDQESIESRLVWIFGSPRSGSTWLLRLLCHPWGIGRTASGIEASRLRPDGPDIVPINESYLPMHLGPLREPIPAAGAAEGAGLLINDIRASDPAYFFSDAYRDTWMAGARQMALARFAAQAELATEEHGLSNPLIVVKEPNGSHAADLIARILPASRVVLLLRDGRDVIDSMLEADSPGGWRTRTEGVEPLVTAEQRLAAVRRQAQLWLVRTIAVERACALLGPDRHLVVRYEELLAETETELGRLDRWLRIGRDERRIRTAVRANRFGSVRNRIRGRRQGVRAASPGLWQQNLSAAEQAAVDELIGAKLRELGY